MTSSAQEAVNQIRSLLGRAGQRFGIGEAEHDEDQQRWLVVTVEAPPELVAPDGRLPGPLADLGETVEVQLRPAPGDQGTELAARVRRDGDIGPDDASDAGQLRGQLRAALRQAKQLVEVGEVLVAGPRPEGYRPRTLTGRLVDRAERGADQGGVL
jgi:hypothetical protein